MRTPIFAMALAVASGLAVASNCPNEVKAIDAKLAQSPKLTEEQATKVKQLRDEGEKAHKAGNHAESMKSLTEAKKILGI